MFFTIEPMINAGKPWAKVLGDGWTAVTRDKSLSAQFEHSIGITENGVEIFTKSPKGLDKPPYSYTSLAALIAAPAAKGAIATNPRLLAPATPTLSPSPRPPPPPPTNKIGRPS